MSDAERPAEAPIVTHTFETTLPSIVVAYRLYGDDVRDGDELSRRAAELVKLNNVADPGFMPITIKARAW